MSTILVGDGDPRTMRFLEVHLRLSGWDVLLCEDGNAALSLALEHHPDLLVLDVAMRGLDGVEVCRRLRRDGRGGNVPVILLTADSSTDTKLRALSAGADECLSKPVHPAELVARAHAVSRRYQELTSRSPLTGLPGNHRVTDEVMRRLDAGEEFALVHADLNHFKAFNDRYGFMRGDDAIRLTARVLLDAVDTCSDGDGFLGHIGGDDFMLIVPARCAVEVCAHAIAEFDRSAPGLYDADDAVRGWVAVADRQGVMRQFPLVTVALGVATTDNRRFADHREMVQVAAEMKSFVKHRDRTRSAFALDTRTAQLV